MAASRPDAPFDACMAEALAQGREWIPRWLNELHEALALGEDRAETLNEKQVFIQARTALAGFRERIAARFLEAVSQLLQANAGQGLETAPSASAASRPLQTMSLDDLTLMDDDRVQQSVDLARVRQAVKLSAEDGSRAFNARLSRAVGLDVVRDQVNPLRPENVVSALLTALDGLHVAPSARALWLNTGASLLGEALQHLYRSLDALLASWGIEPAAYAVIQAPEARSAARGKQNTSSVPQAESMPAGALSANGGLLTLEHLHQLLKGNLAQSGQAVTDQGASGSGNAMVKTLAAEVVTLMLKRVAEDERLLKPVRELLAALKPGMQQLARIDPAYFADQDNLVRQLLDAIAERGHAFNTEQDTGFAAFAGTVHEMARAMKPPAADWMPLVPAWLERIRKVPAAGQQVTGATGRRPVAVHPERNQIAAKVATEIRLREDYARCPAVVRRFLCGPWAQVVAQARLLDATAAHGEQGQGAALRYTDILTDLLWSCQLALASRNRPRLIKLVPHVLRTLRDGLDSIDYPRSKAESFFHALLGLQDAAYKTLLDEQSSVSQAPAPVASTDSGFTVEEAQETRPAFSDTEPMQSLGEVPESAAPSAASGLAVGAWVDLWHEDQALRCQLSRASPHGTLFLFTTAAGRSISLTRHGVETLQEQHRLRPVSSARAAQGIEEDDSRLAWIDSVRTANA